MASASDISDDLATETIGGRGRLHVSGLWAILVLTAVLYGSLIPFHIRLQSFGFENGFGLLNIRWCATTLEDVITNVFIYVPVGLALVLSRRGGRLGSLGSIGGVVLVGVAISVVAESLQTGIAIRVASWMDVALNALGTALGAIAGVAFLRWGLPVARAARKRINERPLSAVAVAVTLGLFVFHLAPFDFVRSSGELHAAFGRADWGFGLRSGQAGQPLGTLVGSLSEAVWFAVLAYFLAFARREAGRSVSDAPLSAIKHGVVLVFVIQLMQLFVRSHAFEAADVVLWSLMVVLGAWVAIFVVDVPTRSRWRRRPGFAVPTLLLAMFVACHVMALLGSGLVAGGLLKGGLGLGRAQWLPFEGLWRGPMVMAAVKVAATALEYGVLVLTLAICLRRVGFQRAWLAAGVTVTLVAVVAEILRTSPVAHAPDLTVPILALLSAVAVSRVYPAVRPATARAR